MPTVVTGRTGTFWPPARRGRGRLPVVGKPPQPPPREVSSRNVSHQPGRAQRAYYDRLRSRSDAARESRQVTNFARSVHREMLDEFPPEERARLMHVAEHGTPREQRRVYQEVLARVQRARARAADKD